MRKGIIKTLFVLPLLVMENVPVATKTIGAAAEAIKTAATTYREVAFGRTTDKREKRALKDEEGRVRFQNVFEEMFTNYSKHLQPNIGTENDWLELKIDMILESLVELDEVEDRMSTVATFKMFWEDFRLKWDERETWVYYMALDEGLIWKPSMKIGNPHDGKTARTDREDVVFVKPNSGVFWSFVKKIDTRCDIDATHFPFDKQFCHIELVFPLFYLPHIKFTHTQREKRIENGKWKIANYKMTDDINYDLYTCFITIEYEFHRKPLNFLLILVIPVLILVSLAPLVFLLPKDGGDRIGLCVTILLAVSVYMTLVADKLPDSSEPMPVINIVLFIWYISSTLITIIVMVLAKVSRIKKRVPHFLKQMVLCTRRCFCQSPIFDSGNKNANSKDEDRKLAEDGAEGSTEDHETGTITWAHVSSAFDKWLFVSLYIVKIIFAVTVFVVLYNGDTEKKGELGDEGHQEPIIIGGPRL